MSELNKNIKHTTIKHAAVKAVDGRIMIGKNHGECFAKGYYMKIEMSPKADDQGFLTSFNGEFVDRFKASEIAYTCGQTDDKKQLLFSEDIWSSESNGKYFYDQLEGYKLKEKNE